MSQKVKSQPKKIKPSFYQKYQGLKKDLWCVRNLPFILAFLIPFLFMFICFALVGVSPFGHNQILVTDLWHQYYPFLVDYQDKLQTGGSLFWTWHSGGGTNYLALMSYYLASPLNFLSVFVPASWLREFLYVITCMKIGFAGLFFSFFLKITFKKKDLSITAFAIAYALCSFIMGYYWNVIWLDTVALLPLVVAGAISLLRDGKFRLYVIALALSILANYYVGLFTCFFVLLVSICYCIVEYKGFKNIIIRFLKMAGFSLLGIAMSAILTLPAYFGLSHTHSVANSFPTTFAINIGSTKDFAGVMEALHKILANSLSFIEPTAKEGLPNIYCGIIAIVLGILFLTCKKIKVRERVACAALLVFFALSFVIRQLDYIWHGFHFPNMLPYRFSFLYSFVLIYMAYRAFMFIDSFKIYQVFIAVGGFALIIALSAKYDTTTTMIGSAFIGFLVIVWLFLYVLKIVPKGAFALALLIIAIAEGACSAYIGVKTVGTSDGTYYPLGTTSTQACISHLEQLEANTIDLPHTEVTKYYTLNDNALNGFNGLSMFSSMTPENVAKYYEKIGLPSWPTSNRFTYQESSPFTNLMMNMKYLISPHGVYLDKNHNALIYQSGNVKLLQCKEYLPMGFMVNSNIQNFSVDTAKENPFDNQNDIFKYATGIDENLYEYLEVKSQGHTDYDSFPVNKQSYGKYSFTVKEGTDNPHLKYNYEAPFDGTALIYFSATGCTDATLKVNDADLMTCYNKRPYIMTLGNVKQGDKLSVYGTIEDKTSGTINVYCAMLKDDVFMKGYEKLQESTLSATKVTDTAIEGTITAKEDGVFYTSISYDPGWSATVDGEKVEVTPVGNALVAFKLSKGTHEIKLSYTPEGFVVGAVLTAVSILIFAFLCYITTRKKKVKVTEKTESEE